MSEIATSILLDYHPTKYSGAGENCEVSDGRYGAERPAPNETKQVDI